MRVEFCEDVTGFIQEVQTLERKIFKEIKNILWLSDRRWVYEGFTSWGKQRWMAMFSIGSANTIHSFNSSDFRRKWRDVHRCGLPLSFHKGLECLKGDRSSPSSTGRIFIEQESPWSKHPPKKLPNFSKFFSGRWMFSGLVCSATELRVSQSEW